MSDSIEVRQRLAPFPHILALYDWQQQTSSILGAWEGTIASDLIGSWSKDRTFFSLITTSVYREEKSTIEGKDPISVRVIGQVRYQFRFDPRGNWLCELVEERGCVSVDVFHLIDQICTLRLPIPEEE